MDKVTYEVKAHDLVQNLVTKSLPYKPTFYDTAWVSMLPEPHIESTTDLAFPEAFEFLLNHQQANGSWSTCDSEEDAILNTLAATLSIHRRCSTLSPDHEAFVAILKARVSKAVTFLHSKMADWEPEAGTHGSFEILAPALLDMLEHEGTTIEFPGRPSLMALNKARLLNFDAQTLCGTERTPMLYFLEAFAGLVDCKNLKKHTVSGAIMQSPASTAAYLMGLEIWDKDSEAYLRNAIQAAGNSGGLPAVFPCNKLEIAIVLETLVESGFSRTCLETDDIFSITNSVGGFVSPAKEFSELGTFSTEEVLAFAILLKIHSPENTFPEFERVQDHLMSKIEVDGRSLNTKCWAIKILLQSPRTVGYERHVSTISQSICDSWWSGGTQDGHHLSILYSMMLYAEAFTQIHSLSENEPQLLLANTHVQTRAPVAVAQILARVLSMQNNDGSWGPRGCAETTAYAVITLLTVIALPYMQALRMEIEHAIAKGRQAMALMHESWTKPHYLWVGKIAYGSVALSQAFSIAAMKKPILDPACREQVRTTIDKRTQEILHFSRFFSNLEHLKNEPQSMIKASVLEAVFYQPSLKAMRTKIFPQTKTNEKDTYLDYIPIMWIIPSTCDAIFSPPEYLLDMMVLSMFIFLVDEYLESNVAQFSTDELEAFGQSVQEIHPEDDSLAMDLSLPGFLHGKNMNTPAGKDPATTVFSDRLRAAISVFQNWATAVMTYPRVKDASRSDLLELRSETKRYILYHLTQLQDNARFAKQDLSASTQFLTPRTSYQTWVHTVGAGHISGPFSFAFFVCSMGGSARHGADCFTHVRQKIIAHNMNAHIGTYCRMYNDYGSIMRDLEERNLNSVNFPEFFVDKLDPDSAKATLLDVAEYERQCAADSAKVLIRDLRGQGSVGRKIADCLRVYIGASDGFSDMYVTRDVTNRVK